MNPQNPAEPRNQRHDTPRPPRQWTSTTDLWRGSRKLIWLHQGEEYLLRITKTGKLILTK
jgi:hemin uptake protein HemP